MAETTPDARIRDLKRRLELDPSSRLFVSLAEEYRKAGRVSDALITLQQGLRNHPGYVSAQVALGRAYIESGNISEAIATFSKVLTSDPGNLVSAKSLADIYLSRGESVEAVKKYKLYRALSGDRTVDEFIERLERELAPPAPRPQARASAAAPLPAPPAFHETSPLATPRSSKAIELPEKRVGPLHPREESFDVTSIKWEEATGGSRKKSDRTAPIALPMPPSAPVSVPEPVSAAPAAPAPPSEPPEPFAPFPVESESPESSGTMASLDEVFAQETDAPFESEPPPLPPLPASERPTDRLEASGDAGTPAPASETTEAEKSEPQGRTLADLYFAQGHYHEALKIYDELVVAHPFDAELKTLRRDAEARLLPASGGSAAPAADAALQRRLAKIRALKQWLSVVQAG